ncbi:DUF4350 domain-containing protein [Candidatus Palauibacter sp.]|uniref:DUF4350 domain-containing protein n=1 Tax=Candidatus Palauibacter sp. TaxID=3101350 RepID=UPI003B013108
MRQGTARIVAQVTVITALAGVAAYLARPEGNAATDVRRSFFRTTPDGVAALARGIDRLGRRTAPRITPLADAGPVPGALVLLSPQVVPSPAEAHALLQRVRAGGTFVYAPVLYPTVYGALRVTPLMDSLGIAFRLTQETDVEDPAWASHALTEGLPSPPAPRRVLRRLTERNLLERAEAERRPSGPPDTASGRPIPPLEHLLTTGPSEDRRWIGAGLIPLGEGRVLVVSDDRSLANGHVADDPLATVVIRALLTHTTPADTVFFDEFHQGIRGYDSTAQRWAGFLFGTPGGRTLFHVLAAAFLALVVAGLRFGSPMTRVSPLDRERRSPLEHVSALGDLYEKSGAARTAALLLLARLARSVRRPPPRDLPEVEALIRELEARRGAHPSLARIRRGLRADPVNLTMIAAGIDDHLAKRSTP